MSETRQSFVVYPDEIKGRLITIPNPHEQTTAELCKQRGLKESEHDFARNIGDCLDPLEARYRYIQRGHFEIIRLAAQSFTGTRLGPSLIMAEKIIETYHRLRGPR